MFSVSSALSASSVLELLLQAGSSIVREASRPAHKMLLVKLLFISILIEDETARNGAAHAN
jgi:hypothetical protein